MEIHQKFTGAFAALALVCVGTVLLSQKVIATGGGSITGSMKLSGTAPHMKGVDMSKDPYCVKQHENNPAKMENVVVGSNDGLQNVVLYISQGLTGNEASAASSQEPVFDQKGCMYTPHVLALNPDQKYIYGEPHPVLCRPAELALGRRFGSERC